MTHEFQSAFEDAKKHARSVFPEESCGFIVNGSYKPVQNMAGDPATHDAENANCECRLCTFRISKADTAKYLGSAQMVLHSHPYGPLYPSQADMQGQIDTGVPWGIIALDETRIGNPEIWSDDLPIAPLLQRSFLHGIRDCYSLIRDTFRTGRDGLIEQEITNEWPYAPIVLKDVPRNDAWWNTEDDHYGLLPPSYGWQEIGIEDAQPGDVFLMKIRSPKFNHAGLLISRDLIMHHLPERFSRREPAGIWARNAGKWLRYTGIITDA